MTLALIAFGIVVLYSTAKAGSGFSGYTLQQTVAAGVGIVAMLFVQRLSFRALRVYAPALVLSALFVAVAVLALAPSIQGARRAFVVGGVSIDPTPFCVLCVTVWAAAYLTGRYAPRTLEEFWRPLGALSAVFGVLFILEPNLGAFEFLFGVIFVLVLVAGSPLRLLLGVATLSIALGIVAIGLEPYRRARFFAFLHPGDDRNGVTYEVARAIAAFRSGGVFGVGLGQLSASEPLPQSHTATVFAAIGEQLGLIGALTVVAAFLVIGYAGLAVSIQTRDVFGKLLAAGLTMNLCLPALLNMASATGIAPLTATVLPFVSFGPAHVVVSLASIGVLLNISVTANSPAHVFAEPVSSIGPRIAATDIGASGDSSSRASVTASIRMRTLERIGRVSHDRDWRRPPRAGPPFRLVSGVDMVNDQLKVTRERAAVNIQKAIDRGIRLIGAAEPASAGLHAPAEWVFDADRWYTVSRHALASTYANPEPLAEFVAATSLPTSGFAERRSDEIGRRVVAAVHAINTLRGFLERLEYAEEVSIVVPDGEPSHDGTLFFVFGHSGRRHEVELFLERVVKHRTTVLADQPGRGRTIIEQFEAHAADAVYSVVLLTGDDEGRERGEGDLRPRARQNVILELGYFIGRIGRTRVAVLRENDVEAPSDIDGVLYLLLDDHGAWKQKLAREMTDAGVHVDLAAIR